MDAGGSRSRAARASGRLVDGAFVLSDLPVSADRLSVRLGDRVVLHDVSFDVQPGEFVGIIGSNGAGKTTLLRTLLGLIRPSSGAVSIFGRPVRRGSRSIGYVAQRTNVDPDLPLRGTDYVSFGLDGERWGFALPSRARTKLIAEAIEAVDATHFADGPIGTLSGGEQQRLFIAQVLLQQPKILMLDEPLSNLDMRSAQEIVNLVARLARERGMTVLFVTHDMNPLMEVMSRVLYLASGHAVAGKVDDVVKEDVLSKLYGYHVDVVRVGDRVIVVADDESCTHP